MIKFTNYWETTIDHSSSKTEVELPEKCDVLIIGGGSNGVSTAFHLAKQGVNVVLIEKYHIGWGASGRNGGMALTGLKEGGGTLIKKYGVEKARAYYHASLDAVDLVRTIIDNEQLPVDVARTGHIEVASKLSHFEGFKQEQTILYKHFGHETQLLTKHELNSELSSDIYYGGLVDGRSIGLNPLQYVTELAKKAEQCGAMVVENCGVIKVTDQQNANKVVTTRGVIECAHLVLSTSAYTEEEFGNRKNSHIKIGSYVMTTEILPFDGEELIRDQRSIYDTLNFLSYYRVTADNRLLFGGRAVFDRESELNIKKSAEILRQMMLNVFPALQKVKVDHVWGGSLDITLNKMPSLQTDNNITFSVGYAGHGISISTYYGKLIADSLTGNETQSPFLVKKIPTVPMPHLQKAYLPIVEKYYRWLDKIN